MVATEMRQEIADPTARVIKLHDWPQIDRDLWLAGTSWDQGYFLQPYAAKLREMTLRNAARAHGRLLAVLADHGLLDETIPPSQRLTRAVADVFVQSLMRAGNGNNTIKVRIFDLRAALKIMEPKVDTAWLSRPGDWSLHVLLPTHHRRRPMVGMLNIYEMGIRLMTQSAKVADPIKRAVMLRNGLIFAIFASRAPRIRALAAMQVGQHVVLDANDCWLVFGSEDIKTRKPIEYRAPPGLLPWLHRYLTVDRPILLQGQRHSAMWVGQGGKPLEQVGIEGMVRRQTRTAFGASFGPHQCRHELASALADAEPANPGLAAAALGITQVVAERDYTHARNNDAAGRVSDHLASERERTRLLAERLFGDHRGDRAPEEAWMSPRRKMRKKTVKTAC